MHTFKWIACIFLIQFQISSLSNITGFQLYFSTAKRFLPSLNWSLLSNPVITTHFWIGKSAALRIPSLIDLDVEESGEKTEEVGNGWRGWWCCLLLVCLITLFLIKNCSRAAIINLPTQACILNGALQTSNKEWASSLNSQTQQHHYEGGDAKQQPHWRSGGKRGHLSAITVGSIMLPLSPFIIPSCPLSSDCNPGHKLLRVRLQTSGGSSTLNLVWSTRQQNQIVDKKQEI